MIIDALKQLGPCLSTDLAKFLVKKHGLSSDAARKRVSRAPLEVKRLGHLPFPRKVRFLYLQGEYSSQRYWDNLYKAIFLTKGAYARALGAVLARGVVPLGHFRICCGAPIAQKKHIPAEAVLDRMLKAKVLVKKVLPGLGECVLAKRTHEEAASNRKQLVAKSRSRLIAEGVLLDSVKEWLRHLALVSYHKVAIRTDKDLPPKVGTFQWDLTAPSYLAGLVVWQKKKLKPGFVVCDVLLERDIQLVHIEPFLNKVKTSKALKNLGHTIFIFVALSYEENAFNALREAGVVPARPESLFGKDIAEAFRELISSLIDAANGSLDPTKFDLLFNKLGKLEGAIGNMRGSLFEFLVAEIRRKTSPAEIQLNKICKGKDGTTEVDIWELKDGILAKIIECKGMKPGALVDDKEVELWLNKRIPRVRQHLNGQGWRSNWPRPIFELWTSGTLSRAALVRIENTRKANAKKYELEVVGPRELIMAAKAVNDRPLLRLLQNHFVPAQAL